MIVNTTRKIIDLANREKPEKYNILTFPTHERYETQLCKTGHNFYSFRMKDMKEWNSEQVPIPENYYITPHNVLVDAMNYDFILVQSKFWQFQIAQQINETLFLPIICLEHTLPTPQTIKPEHMEQMKNMLGTVNVFISEYSRNAWGIEKNSLIIHHGIDTETFKPNDCEKTSNILTVANDFVNRDYCLNYKGWKRVTAGLPVRLVGDTKGLSVSAPSTEALVQEYNSCGVYFNSSTLSPIPTSLLEAMSCGCAVVSTATCMIPEIIKNGENGFISNDESELRAYIEKLLSDHELRNRIGKAARETIVKNFSQDVFIEKWNSLFDTIYEVARK